MSIAQTIYNTLRSGGLTEAGALGMLGNWQCESGLEPNRVQGDFSPYRTVSKEYVARVTSGAISRDQFGRDGKGFGLYQLTYFSRKLGYYDFWKRSGKALDSAELQTEYALKELKEEYPGLLQLLVTGTDLYTCTKEVCVKFERPAVNNIDQRFRAAKDIKAQLQLGDIGQPETGWEKIPAAEYWPPRTVCEGMSGKDVVVLRAVLYAHGFDIDVDDDYFDITLKDCVLNYQNAYGLDVDGIVGNQTWGKLFERG